MEMQQMRHGLNKWLNRNRLRDTRKPPQGKKLVITESSNEKKFKKNT